jgi:hypothetical protein
MALQHISSELLASSNQTSSHSKMHCSLLCLHSSQCSRLGPCKYQTGTFSIVGRDLNFFYGSRCAFLYQILMFALRLTLMNYTLLPVIVWPQQWSFPHDTKSEGSYVLFSVAFISVYFYTMFTEVKSAANDLINRTLVNLQVVGNFVGTWPLIDEKLHRFLHFILHFNHQCAITFFTSLILVGPFVSAKYQTLWP